MEMDKNITRALLGQMKSSIYCRILQPIMAAHTERPQAGQEADSDVLLVCLWCWRLKNSHHI